MLIQEYLFEQSARREKETWEWQNRESRKNSIAAAVVGAIIGCIIAILVGIMSVLAQHG